MNLTKIEEENANLRAGMEALQRSHMQDMGLAIEQRDKAYAEVDRLRAENERQRQENTELHKEVTQANLQIGEVTAHRDRLRDMLNDIRGMALRSEEELSARVLRRIEGDGTEKRSPETPYGSRESRPRREQD